MLSAEFQVTMMSSGYVGTAVTPDSTVSSTIWKIAGTVLTPNVNRVNRYIPQWVLVVNNLWKPWAISIWKYASTTSSFGKQIQLMRPVNVFRNQQLIADSPMQHSEQWKN